MTRPLCDVASASGFEAELEGCPHEASVRFVGVHYCALHFQKFRGMMMDLVGAEYRRRAEAGTNQVEQDVVEEMIELLNQWDRDKRAAHRTFHLTKYHHDEDAKAHFALGARHGRADVIRRLREALGDDPVCESAIRAVEEQVR